jgi:adenylate kinase family enzyme
VTVSLIKKEMEKHGWDAKNYLLDGFPRNFSNVKVWGQMMGQTTTTVRILAFTCDNEILTRRILQRG